MLLNPHPLMCLLPAPWRLVRVLMEVIEQTLNGPMLLQEQKRGEFIGILL